MARFSTNPFAGGVGRSEHVSLESDVPETRGKPNTARPLMRHDLRKGGRRTTASVAILRDDYAAVEIWRAGATTDVHTVDLRFVEPRAIAVRNVPWRLLSVAIGSALLTAAAIALYVMLPAVAQRIGGVLTPISLGTMTVVGFILCYYLTTESLLLLSVHGRARVIAIVGRVGTIRRAQVCAADLVTHIKIAQKQFKPTRQVYLRDEMREHARLYEQGTLSAAQYNEAKRQILKAHE